MARAAGDRAAEDVHEQQQEDDRLDRDVDQLLGRAPGLDQVALGQHERVPHVAGERASGWSASAAARRSAPAGAWSGSGRHAASSSSVSVGRRAAGDGEEDLVQARQVQGQLGDGDAGRVQAGDRGGQGLVAVDRDAERVLAGRLGRLRARRRRSTVRDLVELAAGRLGRTVSRWPPIVRLRPSGVSCAMTRPRSMTVISSASASASSRYCVVSSTVEPVGRPGGARRPTWPRAWPGRGRSSARRGRRRPGGRRARRRGRGGAACRRSRSWRPGRRPRSGRTTRAARPRGARASRVDRSSSWPIMTRFCMPVRSSSTDANWPVSPICCRTCCGCVATSKPATRAVPESARSRVARMRTAVVLPAPFGPSTPSTEPSRAARSMPASAWVSPKRLVRPSASMAFVMPSWRTVPARSLARRVHRAGTGCQPIAVSRCRCGRVRARR